MATEHEKILVGEFFTKTEDVAQLQLENENSVLLFVESSHSVQEEVIV